jgi:hypothetical protein
MDYNSINGRFIELSDEQDDFDWEFD